jgi:DNA-binding Lrp family transcriptional regulator
MATFDILDNQLIRLLHANARRSASEIARELGANERTIRKRIDRLVGLGAVRLTAIVTPEAFGYVTAVDIFLEVEPAHEEAVIQTLLDTPEVSYIALGQGTRDLSIECRFKNNHAMHDFLRKRLPSVTGVQITGYSLVPRIIRNIDAWLPSQTDFLEGFSGDQ